MTKDETIEYAARIMSHLSGAPTQEELRQVITAVLFGGQCELSLRDRLRMGIIEELGKENLGLREALGHIADADTVETARNRARRALEVQ